MNNIMIFTLQTPPAITCSGMSRFRKELVRVGHYVKDSTKQNFDITVELIDHWVDTFHKWIEGGNKVSIPNGHENEGIATANMGWVREMYREGDTLVGELELLNPDLALVSDVSIAVPKKVTDGNGVVYNQPIIHVALTTVPVVGGLEEFIELSLDVGETKMNFLKKLAERFKAKEETEESVLLAIGNFPEKVELSEKHDPVVKLVSENRELKLSNLVKAGLITPAVKDVIAAKYVDKDVLALSLADKHEDGFDLLYDVLVQNKPVNLDEVTGIQNIELAKQSTDKPNAMQQEVSKRRKDVGMDA